MRKNSKQLSDISESGGWCDLRMKPVAEWPSEGSLKSVGRVGADGNRTRYQSGVYVCT